MRRNHQYQQGVQQQQSSLAGLVLATHAFASVTGGGVPAFLRQRGFAAIARTAAGIYTMDMSDALDVVGGDGIITTGLNGVFAVGATIQVSPTTATRLTVTLATVTAVPAAAAADISYWVKVEAIGPN